MDTSPSRYIKTALAPLRWLVRLWLLLLGGLIVFATLLPLIAYFGADGGDGWPLLMSFIQATALFRIITALWVPVLMLYVISLIFKSV